MSTSTWPCFSSRVKLEHIPTLGGLSFGTEEEGFLFSFPLFLPWLEGEGGPQEPLHYGVASITSNNDILVENSESNPKKERNPVLGGNNVSGVTQ